MVRLRVTESFFGRSLRRSLKTGKLSELTKTGVDDCQSEGTNGAIPKKKGEGSENLFTQSMIKVSLMGIMVLVPFWTCGALIVILITIQYLSNLWVRIKYIVLKEKNIRVFSLTFGSRSHKMVKSSKLKTTFN